MFLPNGFCLDRTNRGKIRHVRPTLPPLFSFLFTSLPLFLPFPYVRYTGYRHDAFPRFFRIERYSNATLDASPSIILDVISPGLIDSIGIFTACCEIPRHAFRENLKRKRRGPAAVLSKAKVQRQVLPRQWNIERTCDTSPPNPRRESYDRSPYDVRSGTFRNTGFSLAFSLLSLEIHQNLRITVTITITFTITITISFPVPVTVTIHQRSNRCIPLLACFLPSFLPSWLPQSSPSLRRHHDTRTFIKVSKTYGEIALYA